MSSCKPQSLGVASLVLLGLLLAGCKSAAPAPPPAMGPAEVAFVTVQPERTLLTTQLPGRTAAYLVAEIRPQVNGLIQSRQFEEGAFVKAGQLLYQIDPTPYEAAYNQAKAAVATAEADLITAQANLPAIKAREERFRGLVAIKAVGQQDYDDAAAALRQAEANVETRKRVVESAKTAVEMARVNLSYTPIKSPISGRIGVSNITVGGLASAYQPIALAVVQQLDPIYVDVTQASADVLSLRRRLESGRLKRDGGTSNRVQLFLEDGTPYPLKGALKFQDVTVDPATGSVRVRMVFPNPHNVLLPGMFVRALVEEGVNDRALLVPQQGVTRDLKGNPVAMVVGKEDKVELRMLTVDRAIGDKWLVLDGLAAGDKIIVDGLQRVRPGVPVRAVPYAAPQPQPGGPPAGKPMSRLDTIDPEGSTSRRDACAPSDKGEGHV